MIDFSKTMTKDNLSLFADYVKDIQAKIPFKVSARGWCYQLETERIINKNQFNKVEGWINRCRRLGLLPIDFVAEEAAREFEGVETESDLAPSEYLAQLLMIARDCGDYYDLDWWDGEDTYIQLIVEKIDLKTLFAPICKRFHIPIASSKGWSSMMQRAEYARRFQEAADRGLDCVLLYCGDHDPDGLRISDFLRSNLEDLQDVTWRDGMTGYDPTDLIIDRFGLNEDFIEEHNLTWIDNLITGSDKNLASPSHRNYKQPYVQNYLRQFGAKKCEANAIITIPHIARAFVNDVIIGYLGDDVLERFQKKRDAVIDEIDGYQDKYGIKDAIAEMLDDLEQ